MKDTYFLVRRREREKSDELVFLFLHAYWQAENMNTLRGIKTATPKTNCSLKFQKWNRNCIFYARCNTYLFISANASYILLFVFVMTTVKKINKPYATSLDHLDGNKNSSKFDPKPLIFSSSAFFYYHKNTKNFVWSV